MSKVFETIEKKSTIKKSCPECGKKIKNVEHHVRDAHGISTSQNNNSIDGVILDEFETKQLGGKFYHISEKDLFQYIDWACHRAFLTATNHLRNSMVIAPPGKKYQLIKQYEKMKHQRALVPKELKELLRSYYKNFHGDRW